MMTVDVLKYLEVIRCIYFKYIIDIIICFIDENNAINMFDNVLQVLE